MAYDKFHRKLTLSSEKNQSILALKLDHFILSLYRATLSKDIKIVKNGNELLIRKIDEHIIYSIAQKLSMACNFNVLNV